MEGVDDMPIEAIEGKVRSEPLNRNFSALDSEIGYAAGYVSGDTILHYDANGAVVGVTTPMSEIMLEYDNDGILTKVVEEFEHRSIKTSLEYDSDGVLIKADKEVTEK